LGPEPPSTRARHGGSLGTHETETTLDITTREADGLSGDELALVLDAACAAVFHLDVATGAVRWSGSLAALSGGNDAAPATLEAFLARVHPEDRAGVRAAIAETAPDGASTQRDLRLVGPDGAAHWYDARWRRVFGAP
jgi:two-component system, LuxR family, sensor kinase FixL